MRKYHSLFAGGILVAVLVGVRADESSPRALLEKAVKAHGGQALLEKYPAYAAKIRGTFHGLGEAAPFTGEAASDGPERQKLVIDVKLEGEKVRIVTVLNRGKGWAKINDDTEELEGDDLVEMKHEAYAEWVATLAPLKNKSFKLAALGELKIDGRPALGLRVTKEENREVKLYFDKATNLLVKTETRIKDDDGEEVTEETFLSAYKNIQGIQQALRSTVKRGGKLYMEMEASEYRLAERLEERVFARP